MPALPPAPAGPDVAVPLSSPGEGRLTFGDTAGPGRDDTGGGVGFFFLSSLAGRRSASFDGFGGASSGGGFSIFGLGAAGGGAGSAGAGAGCGARTAPAGRSRTATARGAA